MISSPQNEMLDFYRAVRDLMADLQRSENIVNIQLKPGQICIVDNWRILHNHIRHESHHDVTVSRTHYLSAARKLKLID